MKKNGYKTLLILIVFIVTMFSFSKKIFAQNIPSGTTTVYAGALHEHQNNESSPTSCHIDSSLYSGTGFSYPDGNSYPYCILNCPQSGNASDTHCIQNGVTAGVGTRVNSYPAKYNVAYRIEITGNNSKVYNNNSSSSTPSRTYSGLDINAKMNAICGLSPTPQNIYIDEWDFLYSKKQIGVWMYAPSFLAANGISNVADCGISRTRNADVTTAYDSCESIANAYATTARNASSGTSASITNNTYSATVVNTTIGGVEYYKVGPFKFTYNGTISSVSVRNQNGTTLNYKTYKNTTTYNGYGAISSGSQFYVLLTPDTTSTKMTITVNVRKENEIKTAKVWVLTHNSGQNLITVTSGSSTNSSSDSASASVDLYTQIHIGKRGNLPSSGIALGGVKYKIGVKKNGTIKYLTFYSALSNKSTNKSGSTVTKPSYVTNISSAFEFETNSSGNIDLYQIDIGTEYVFVETYNPNYGYEEYPNITTTKSASLVMSSSTTRILFNNSRKWTDLRIAKMDSNRSNIALPGVKFRIKNSSGQYLYYDGVSSYNKTNGISVSPNNSSTGKPQVAKFTSSVSNAQVFITDSSGYIKARMLPLGTYTFEEIENPNYGYEDMEIYGGTGTRKHNISFTATGAEVSLTGSYIKTANSIKNVKKYTRLQIVKQDRYKSSWKLAGVKFKVYNATTGKYIRFDTTPPSNSTNRTGSTWIEPKYGTASQAFIFETDSSGKINIDHVAIGDYVFVEIENPNYGYETKKIYNYYGSSTNQQKISTDGYESDINGNYTRSSPPAIQNVREFTDIYIRKVNKDDTSIALDGVKFKVRFENRLSYIYFDGMPAGLSTNKKSDGTWYEPMYTTDINKAYEFVTDSNGYIEVCHVSVWETTSSYYGDYKFFETYNPHYGYEPNPTFEAFRLDGFEVSVYHSQLKPANLLKNKQIWVKLSGYVWEDIASGKATVRDNVYTSDSSDQLIDYAETASATSDERIWVRLKNKTTGEIITHYDIEHSTCSNGVLVSKGTNLGPQEMTTGTPYDKGHYMFWEVEITELSNYMVEFQYDGLIYSYVVPKISQSNGSKAAENANDRLAFDSQFGKVYHGPSDSTYTGRTEGLSEYSGVLLNYKSGTEDYTTNLDPARNYFKIFANTKETSLNIRNKFSWGMEEIPNINLGVYRRDQPDLSLTKSVEDARLIINGYEHIYRYNKSNVTNDNTYSSEVGVKFSNERNARYTHPIYRADAVREYNDSKDDLRAYITYKITVTNESTTLTNKVYQINDYLDSWFEINELTKAGTTYDGVTTFDIGNEISYTTKTDGSNHILQIPVNISLQPGEEKCIYVQVCASRQRIKEICDSNESGSTAELINYAEIASYATYKNNKIYAGIDSDSAPGNFNLNNVDGTYEDDTGKAPGIRFVYGDNDTEGRVITGNVFEDLVVAGKTGKDSTEELLGDGIFQSTEKGIEGVKVVLRYADGTQDPAFLYVKGSSGTYYKTNSEAVNITTDSNGNYTIHGYTPDKYYLEFTWGDETYVGDLKDSTGVNPKYNKYSPFYFKSTISPSIEGNRTNPGWYSTLNPRYNDAVDTQQSIEEIRDKVGTEFVYENTIEFRENAEDVLVHSETATFSVGIENNEPKQNEPYSSTIDVSITDPKLNYKVENIDFGIIEKAPTRLIVKKLIEEYKVTLPNGSVFATGHRVGDTIQGESKYAVYVSQDMDSPINKGRLLLQMDTEMMLNSTVEVKYSFEVINDSAIVYDSLDYYWYGRAGSAPKIKISLGSIVDYMDEKWDYKNKSGLEKNQWEEVSDDLISAPVSINSKQYKKIADFVTTNDTFKRLNKLLKQKDVSVTPTKTVTEELEPGSSSLLGAEMNSLITSKTNLDYVNSTNILEIDRQQAETKIPITPPEKNPGEYIPDTPTKFYAKGDIGYPAEDVHVIPPTGSGFEMQSWVIVSIIALTVLGVGIVIIIKVTKE